jgi:AdoMet-dependent heme synthase
VTVHPTENVLRLLFWESTAGCNLACSHCRRTETGSEGDLSTEKAKGLLASIADLGKRQGADPVVVFSGGEPLTRGDIMDLVAYAASLSLVPALATNGTLIDGALAGRLKSAGVARVAVSIDGADAKIHDSIRNQAGSYDGAMRGIEALRRAGVPFQLNFTLTRSNSGDLSSVYALAESLGAEALHVFILVPVGCGRELADSEVLEPGQYEQKLLEIGRMAVAGSIQIKVTCGPQFERIIRQHGIASAVRHHGGSAPGAAPHAGAPKGCLAGTGVLFVSHTGTAFPCGYLPIGCGSILESSLEELWRLSRPLMDLRDPGRLKGKCGLCEYKLICGGCRARAYAVTGDCFAEEPSCAYVPGGRGGMA